MIDLIRFARVQSSVVQRDSAPSDVWPHPWLLARSLLLTIWDLSAQEWVLSMQTNTEIEDLIRDSYGITVTGAAENPAIC